MTYGRIPHLVSKSRPDMNHDSPDRPSDADTKTMVWISAEW